MLKNTTFSEKSRVTSPTSEVKEGTHKYDGLKIYREGPNTESGELDPKSESKESWKSITNL
jgi:hypothetical protein